MEPGIKSFVTQLGSKGLKLLRSSNQVLLGLWERQRSKVFLAGAVGIGAGIYLYNKSAKPKRSDEAPSQPQDVCSRLQLETNVDTFGFPNPDPSRFECKLTCIGQT